MKKGINSIFTALDRKQKDWFQLILDEIYEKSKRPSKPIDYFYASWAGDCPRAIQYSMNCMMPDTIDAQCKRRMDNGNYMHSRYGDYFKNTNRLIEAEPAFKMMMDGVFISGRSDLIILKDDGSKSMLELKSINDRKYKLIKDAPDYGDYLQWNLCAKALNFNEGIILYENKNTQDIAYHFVEFNEEKYQEVIKDFILIDKCNKEGTLVPRPEKCPNARYCGMKDSCK